jgi:hypothetical protein
MSMKIENLSDLDKDELLRWFMHWLPMDRRAEMMRRYPQHYNKMVPPSEDEEPLLPVVQRADGPREGVQYVVNGETRDDCPEMPVRKPACER